MKTNPSLNRSLTTLLCAATASLLILSQPAQAGYVVTLDQVGSNVVATGTGPIDLTGLTLLPAGGIGNAVMFPSSGNIFAGTGSASRYQGLTGPTSFGIGSQTGASSFSGPL